MQQRIGTDHVLVGDARKKVTYWSMRYLGGEFEPNDEVDAVEWLRRRRRAPRLSYDVDRSVLRDFAVGAGADSVIVLVRHAKAGKRSDWHGDDGLRPLDAGRRAAGRGTRRACCRRSPRRASYAADLTRCVQTVEPLARRARSAACAIEPAFSDEAYDDGPAGTRDLAAGAGQARAR